MIKENTNKESNNEELSNFLDTSSDGQHERQNFVRSPTDAMPSSLHQKNLSKSSNYAGSKKKLNQIHSDLVHLENKFSKFENNLKFFSIEGQKRCNSQNMMRSPRVQVISSVPKGDNSEQKKIIINNKTYTCRNFPASYFRNVDEVYDSNNNKPVKRKSPVKADTKAEKQNCKPKIFPRSLTKTAKGLPYANPQALIKRNPKFTGIKTPRLQVSPPKIGYNSKDLKVKQEQNYINKDQFSKQNSSSYLKQRLLFLTPHDSQEKTHSHHSSDKKNEEQAKLDKSHHSISRQKQLQNCVRMMNNRHRINRYCKCCSHHDEESFSLQKPVKKQKKSKVNFIQQNKNFIANSQKNLKSKSNSNGKRQIFPEIKKKKVEKLLDDDDENELSELYDTIERHSFDGSRVLEDHLVIDNFSVQTTKKNQFRQNSPWSRDKSQDEEEEFKPVPKMMKTHNDNTLNHGMRSYNHSPQETFHSHQENAFINSRPYETHSVLGKTRRIMNRTEVSLSKLQKSSPEVLEPLKYRGKKKPNEKQNPRFKTLHNQSKGEKSDRSNLGRQKTKQNEKKKDNSKSGNKIFLDKVPNNKQKGKNRREKKENRVQNQPWPKIMDINDQHLSTSHYEDNTTEGTTPNYHNPRLPSNHHNNRENNLKLDQINQENLQNYLETEKNIKKQQNQSIEDSQTDQLFKFEENQNQNAQQQNQLKEMSSKTIKKQELDEKHGQRKSVLNKHDKQIKSGKEIISGKEIGKQKQVASYKSIKQQLKSSNPSNKSIPVSVDQKSQKKLSSQQKISPKKKVSRPKNEFNMNKVVNLPVYSGKTRNLTTSNPMNIGIQNLKSKNSKPKFNKNDNTHQTTGKNMHKKYISCGNIPSLTNNKTQKSIKVPKNEEMKKNITEEQSKKEMKTEENNFEECESPINKFNTMHIDQNIKKENTQKSIQENMEEKRNLNNEESQSMEEGQQEEKIQHRESQLFQIQENSIGESREIQQNNKNLKNQENTVEFQDKNNRVQSSRVRQSEQNIKEEKQSLKQKYDKQQQKQNNQEENKSSDKQNQQKYSEKIIDQDKEEDNKDKKSNQQNKGINQEQKEEQKSVKQEQNFFDNEENDNKKQAEERQSEQQQSQNKENLQNIDDKQNQAEKKEEVCESEKKSQNIVENKQQSMQEKDLKKEEDHQLIQQKNQQQQKENKEEEKEEQEEKNEKNIEQQKRDSEKAIEQKEEQKQNLEENKETKSENENMKKQDEEKQKDQQNGEEKQQKLQKEQSKQLTEIQSKQESQKQQQLQNEEQMKQQEKNIELEEQSKRKLEQNKNESIHSLKSSNKQENNSEIDNNEKSSKKQHSSSNIQSQQKKESEKQQRNSQQKIQSQSSIQTKHKNSTKNIQHLKSQEKEFHKQTISCQTQDIKYHAQRINCTTQCQTQGFKYVEIKDERNQLCQTDQISSTVIKKQFNEQYRTDNLREKKEQQNMQCQTEQLKQEVVKKQMQINQGCQTDDIKFKILSSQSSIQNQSKQSKRNKISSRKKVVEQSQQCQTDSIKFIVKKSQKNIHCQTSQRKMQTQKKQEQNQHCQTENKSQRNIECQTSQRKMQTQKKLEQNQHCQTENKSQRNIECQTETMKQLVKKQTQKNKIEQNEECQTDDFKFTKKKSQKNIECQTQEVKFVEKFEQKNQKSEILTKKSQKNIECQTQQFNNVTSNQKKLQQKNQLCQTDDLKFLLKKSQKNIQCQTDGLKHVENKQQQNQLCQTDSLKFLTKKSEKNIECQTDDFHSIPKQNKKSEEQNNFCQTDEIKKKTQNNIECQTSMIKIQENKADHNEQCQTQSIKIISKKEQHQKQIQTQSLKFFEKQTIEKKEGHPIQCQTQSFRFIEKQKIEHKESRKEQIQVIEQDKDKKSQKMSTVAIQCVPILEEESQGRNKNSRFSRKIDSQKNRLKSDERNRQYPASVSPKRKLELYSQLYQFKEGVLSNQSHSPFHRVYGLTINNSQRTIDKISIPETLKDPQLEKLKSYSKSNDILSKRSFLNYTYNPLQNTNLPIRPLQTPFQTNSQISIIPELVKQKKIAQIVRYIEPQVKNISSGRSLMSNQTGNGNKIKKVHLKNSEVNSKLNSMYNLSIRILKERDHQNDPCDFINRLFAGRSNKTCWLFHRGSFQEMGASSVLNSTITRTKIILTYLNELFVSKPLEHISCRSVLQTLTGVPILPLKLKNWNKLRKIHQHPNIYGLAINYENNLIHSIAGTQQVPQKENKEKMKLVSLENEQGKKYNIKWEEFLQQYNETFIVCFHPKYHLRYQHVTAPLERDHQCFIIEMNVIQSFNLNETKAHCVMGFQADQTLGGNLSVYSEISSNKYEYIGCGEMNFVSMRVTPRKYLLVLEKCRPGLFLATCSMQLTLKGGKWASDIKSALSCEKQQLIKCQF